jgi:hypothetical protein
MDAKADGRGDAKVGLRKKPEPGDRVGAVMSADKVAVKFFGWGVFKGREVPDKSVGGEMGDVLREMGVTNPKIVLDSGKVVWGCECWWGSEAEVKAMLEGRVLIEVDIDEARKAAQPRG